MSGDVVSAGSSAQAPSVMQGQQRDFVHLHVHTEYSLVDGALRVGDYVDTLVEQGMSCGAVTELNNVFSMIKFYRRCLAHGVKPIIGAEINLADETGADKDQRLVLLCQNNDGFRNLSELLTLGFTQGQTRGAPVIQRDWLHERAGGLIALSGAGSGAVGQALMHNQPEAAREQLGWFLELFPQRFYLELQRTGRAGEDVYIDETLELAAEFAVPVVATNDVRFQTPDDFSAHEARVCIHDGYLLNDPKRPQRYSNEQYLKSPEQMHELFHDLPEALQNSVNIAIRCNLEMQLGEHHLPEFPVPEGFDQSGWLRKQADDGLDKLVSAGRAALNGSGPEQYRQRLDDELKVIIDMGFPGYFLIVADFIRWAREQGIPVGPGRGSGGGSLVAYVLGITDLDPIEHELLFERFLNPDRVSLPDFDVDFCMDRRDEVIEYVSVRYGRGHVSQIITFGSMAAKAVVRDVGRVLGHPYGFVDKIAKLIPFELEMTLDKALQAEELLKQRYTEEEEVTILIDLAKKLEGLPRNAGRHAGGIVISPRPLTEFVPLYCERNTAVTSTQFDMGDVEAVGLIKFDFLGLRTLTCIDWAVRDVNELTPDNSGGSLDIGNIALDDAATYATIRRMDTTAVFQLESDGMRKLIKRLEPDKFDDLVALVALFRPGPLDSGMVDDFIDRKKGKAKVRYLHPSLEPILQPTYGVILYQEQVMQIARTLGGYTLGSADLLRRAMGKKKREEMAEQRSIFVRGAEANEVKKTVATSIFDLMEKFAGYGFNKSHSVAYALLAYQTAWLKTHYPAAFMAATLSADMNNTDRTVRLVEELPRMKLVLKPPSVNHSSFKFTVVDKQTILFGLGAVKGVGRSAINNVCEERQQQGAYSNLFDFCRRTDPRKVNKRVHEALIRCGALDDFGQPRSVLAASLEKALRFAEQSISNADTGQDDLFGAELLQPLGADVDAAAVPYVSAPDWADQERLKGEKETVGFYLSGHPITRYERELAPFISVRLSQVQAGMKLTVAGYIENLRIRTGKRGRMVELLLDDRTARLQVTVYDENYQKYGALLQKDSLVIMKGEAKQDDYYDTGVSIVAAEVYSLAELRRRYARIRLKISKNMVGNGFVAGLQQVLSQHGTGTNQVLMEYNNGQVSTVLNFGDGWDVNISDELMTELSDMIGAANVCLDFPGRVKL